MSNYLTKPDRTSKLIAGTSAYREQVAAGVFDNNEVTPALQDGHIKISSLDESRFIVVRGHNNTGVTIVKNKFVYFNGWDPTSGSNTYALAENTTPNYTDGFLVRDQADGETGHVANYGVIEGVDTLAATAGDPVYLGINGDWTLTKPNNAQQLGVVLHSDALVGAILIHLVAVQQSALTITQTTVPSSGSPPGLYLVTQGIGRGLYVSHGVGEPFKIISFDSDGS